MELREVKKVLGAEIRGRAPAGAEVTGVSLHSRDVRPGGVFLAVRGAKQDGAAFVDDAIRRGAIAIVSDQPLVLPPGVVLLQVAEIRKSVADLACAFYGHPSASLQVCGITGTNGKTTTATMLKSVLEASGKRTGMIGTIAYEIGDRSIAATRTTPDAIQLQQLMRDMVRVGCEAAVLEVSSHALDQQRTAGIRFAVAGFTNLTQDHLDYHGSMENYYAAKALLFRGLDGDAVAAIDADDPYGAKLAGEALACRIFTTGLQAQADVRAEILHQDLDGSICRVVSPWGTFECRLGLPGRFNVRNALVGFTMACGVGVAPQTALSALERMQRVRGRLQPVPVRTPFRVFVDYAHTDDALRRVLGELKTHTPGRLLVVFGCGGNRDQGKRHLMGKAVADLADFAVITSDNPRNENPAIIIDEVRHAFPEAGNVVSEVDRRAAIRLALEKAEKGDTLCIAGKGHETYQEVEGRMLPFDDVAVASEELLAMGYKRL